MTATETGLMPYAAPQAEEYRARIVMTPDDAKALDAQLRACTLAVLREGIDYGPIPGTDDKKVLHKPGAEKLLQWFGLVSTCDRVEVEHDSDGRKEGVTYRATISKQLPDGRIIPVASCEGYAGYDEDKFYRTAEEAQFKAEAKERFWAEKDRRVANPNKWKHITEYRAPWNTIIKMAQKRALVGATVDATAAAGLFSDDDGLAAPADEGPSLATRLLDEAAAFRGEVRGQEIWRDAAHAAREGLITPGQATHVQNRVKIRLASLRQAAKPVHVGTLARQAAQDTSPAAQTPVTPQPETETAGEAPASAPDEASSPDRHRKLVGITQAHFKRLGFNAGDTTKRISATAKLAGTSGIGSTNDLDEEELSTVIDALAQCRNRAELDALLKVAEDIPGDGDE